MPDTLQDASAAGKEDDAVANNKVKSVFSPGDIRHNMIVAVMLEAIFNTGAADLSLVVTPLYVFLNASNTLVGFMIGTLASISLIGVFLSPFISVRCPLKKWYLFYTHLPYIGTWGVMGLVLVFSEQLGLSRGTILTFVIIMMGANYFFGGFVGLPHQEYVAACIPMSHRGRYNGYSLTFGAVAALGSNALGGVILYYVVKPMAFGYLYLMAWFLCQAGYAMALFARERPTPIERAPKPWSKAMIKAVWEDKPFLRVIVLYQVFQVLFQSTFMTYLPIYALRDLKLISAMVAVIGTTMLVARMASSTFIGHATDRFSPKRVLPLYPILGALALVPVIAMQNQWGVYIGAALGAIFLTGYQNAFGTLTYGVPKPEHRTGHFTSMLLLSYTCQAIGVPIVGALCDGFGFRVAFALVAASALLLVPITKYYLSVLSSNPEEYS